MSEHPIENDGISNEDADGQPKANGKYGRRALMLGAAAGVGAAASLIGGAESAEAANGGPVLLGKANSAKATTSVTTTKGDGLSGTTSADGDAGVFGWDNSSGGGFGLQGYSDAGSGLYAQSVSDSGISVPTAGVIGDSNPNPGVVGLASDNNGVVGITTRNGWGAVFGDDQSPSGGYGVQGWSNEGTGVQGVGPDNGVYGSSTNGYGVLGTSSGSDGVHANTTHNGSSGVAGIDTSSGGGYGLYGNSDNGTGVYGNSNSFDGYGVYGNATGGFPVGVYASSENGYAVYANGEAEVTGNLYKGGGGFKIDHPADPAGKYLYHSFVESPDMKNVYDGTVTLDGEGQATVELPDWFEVLNRDYRYQLTAIGGPAPDLHISREVKDGTFSIAGGKADQKVSWQVTGIRQDAWANSNRIPVEVDKPAHDQGRYLHPELHGGEAITIMAKARAFARRHNATRPVSRRAAQP